MKKMFYGVYAFFIFIFILTVVIGFYHGYPDCDIIDNGGLKIVDNKECYYVNDTLRIMPFDHRFDEICDVLYVLQDSVDLWNNVDTCRGERFYSLDEMVRFFKIRQSWRANGDSIQKFRLFDRIRR
jgi:hypothetical protein